MSEERYQDEEEYSPNPLAINFLSGIYLFILIRTVVSYGSPFPFFGVILEGGKANSLILADSIAMLYLFVGILKRQKLTWRLLIGYNFFEIGNIIVNLLILSRAELEKALGRHIDTTGLVSSNMIFVLAIIALTIFIYRSREHFDNNSPYLF